MATSPIIGVMGPGDEASPETVQLAEELGACIAQKRWTLLSGGRNSGVMDAVNRGAKREGGLTIGILPTREKSKTSAFVDVPIYTDMGSARNNINVISSDVVIACGMGKGTASEVALALKANKTVLLLGVNDTAQAFFKEIGGALLLIVNTPSEAIERITEILSL